VDLAAERSLAEVLIRASRDDLVDAAHDLSEGGLVQGLVEASLRFGIGVQVDLEPLCARDGVTPFEALFSESTARALVAVPRSEEVRFTDLCTARGVPVLRLGVTDDTCAPGAGVPDAAGAGADHAHEPAVEVAGLFTLPLSEARAAHEGTLPRHFA
jgi:phosphoribosylformylglycinamidine synthase